MHALSCAGAGGRLPGGARPCSWVKSIPRARFPLQISDRPRILRVRAGGPGDADKGGEDGKDGKEDEEGGKLGGLFQRELQKRNISSVDDIQDVQDIQDSPPSGRARADASSSYVPPPQFASGFGPADEEEEAEESSGSESEDLFAAANGRCGPRWQTSIMKSSVFSRRLPLAPLASQPHHPRRHPARAVGIHSS